MKKVSKRNLNVLKVSEPFSKKYEGALQNVDRWFQLNENKVARSSFWAFLEYYGQKRLTEILFNSQMSNYIITITPSKPYQ